MEEQITVRLPKTLSRSLTMAAERAGRKRADIVRAALERYLGEEEPQQHPYEKVKHLIGMADFEPMTHEEMVKRIRERAFRPD
ncbi:MAG TPA: ribbon-helix-helix protein, CopG family [Candidatus Xenobia bacterium]